MSEGSTIDGLDLAAAHAVIETAGWPPRDRAHEWLARVLRAGSDSAGREVAAERNAALRDFDEQAAKYSGGAKTDAFARVVLDGARLALVRGQVRRAGACGKPQACGGGCSLPAMHEGACSCQIDGSECTA